MSDFGESETSSSDWAVVDQSGKIQDEECSSNTSSIELLDDDDNDEVENGEDNERNTTLISSLAPKFIHVLRIPKKQHQDNLDLGIDEMSNITKDPIMDEMATGVTENCRTDEMATKITEDQLINNNSVSNSVQHSSNPLPTILGGGQTGQALVRIPYEYIEAFRQTIEDLKVSLLPTGSRQCSIESVETFKDQTDKQTDAYDVQLTKSLSVPFDTGDGCAIDSMQSSVSSSYSFLTRDRAAETIFVNEDSTDIDMINVPENTCDHLEQAQHLELNKDREDGQPISTEHVEQGIIVSSATPVPTDTPVSPATPVPTAMWYSFSGKSICVTAVALIMICVGIKIAIAYRLSNGYQDPKQFCTEYLQCRASLNMARQANTDLVAQVGKLRYSGHSSPKDPAELNKDHEYEGQASKTQWTPKEQSNTLEISSKLESLEKENYKLISENIQLKRLVEKMEHNLNESTSRRNLSLAVSGNNPGHVTLKNCLTVLAQQYKHGHLQCLHSLSCIKRILSEYTAECNLQQDSELHDDGTLNNEPEKDHHSDGNVKMDTENLVKDTNEYEKEKVNHKHNTDQGQTKENKVDGSWTEQSKSPSDQTSEQTYHQSGASPKEPDIDHHTNSNTWGILTGSLFDVMNKTQKQIQMTWEKMQNMSTTIWRKHEPSLVKLRYTFSKKFELLGKQFHTEIKQIQKMYNFNRWFRKSTDLDKHSEHRSAHPTDAFDAEQTQDNNFKDKNIFIKGFEEIGFRMCQLNFHKFKMLLTNKRAALVQFQSNFDNVRNMYQTTENRILSKWLECQATWWSNLDSPMVGDDCIKYLYCWQVKVANGDVRLCHKWKKHNLHAFEDSCSLREMLESIEASTESMVITKKDGKCVHDAKSNTNCANTDTENEQSQDNQKPNIADKDDKLYGHLNSGQTKDDPEDDDFWDSEDDWFMARAKEREYLHQEPDDWYFRRNKKGKFADSVTTVRR